MTDHRKPGWAFWSTVALLVALILYVAGLGPATWLFRKYPATAPAIWVIYYPARSVYVPISESHWKPIVVPLDAYTKWWADLADP